MPTRLTSERPQVTRVVPGRPTTVRVKELVVKIQWTPAGGIIELRPLKHKRAMSVFVDKLYDQLHWREAKLEAQRKSKEKRKGKPKRKR